MNRRALLIVISATLALVLGGCPGGGKKKGGGKKTSAKTAAKTGKKLTPAAPAFDRSKASKTPWLKAEVGHYAIIMAPSTKDKQKTYCKVTKVEDAYVTWSLFTDATFTKEVPNRETKVDLAREESKFQDPATLLGVDKSKVTTETLTIGDKKLKCRVVYREIKGRGVPTKNWVADPGQGLMPFLQTVGNAVAISERGGKREYEIIEFGKK